MLFLILFALVALAISLAAMGKTWLAWVLPSALGLGSWWFFGAPPSWLLGTLGAVLGLAALVTGVKPLRRAILSGQLMRLMAPIMPRMSDTEREALDAGTVWWDAELFSGRPDWKKLVDFRPEGLSEKERAFLGGPVEEVCNMVTEWEVNQAGELSPAVWDFLKKNGFMGMIIPEEYGGLGFSALANSAVVTKLSSRSIGLAVTVMVPNSLGPAELLGHYGTDEQKNELLPRLASGEEVPAFALTEPNAGSDAAGMTSNGVVCKGEWEGKEVLGIRLNWEKRYITLAPVATLLGLAFKLHDPERLLGGKEHYGITCALVPADLPGVEVGERHDPLGVAFNNGPTRGKDVFVPIDAIIGGPEMAGQGWRMLMQSLAAGRGISLPSMSVGAAELATRTAGAYASVRKQFNVAIGKFEGIEEPLARIAGQTYLMDAARILTVGAIDSGEKPSVLTAVVKCYLTEGMRDVINDAMDVVGGAGICRGPNNILAGCYSALPIGITVEGANILTRSMIIFGQGAMRCHPFAKTEVDAVLSKNLEAFDTAFFGHVGFVFQNASRSFLLGLTGGRLSPAPVDGVVAPYFGQLSRMSAAFAFLADVCMGTLGGSLKFKETITGRLADALSWMYLASATLKRFVDAGQPERDRAYAIWGLEYSLYQIQEAIDGVLRNHPLKPLRWLLRPVLFPTGARLRLPSDALSRKVAKGILEDGEARLALTKDIYLPPPSEPGLGVLEDTLGKVVKASAVDKKLRAAVKERRLEKKPASTLHQRAHEAGVLTDDDLRVLQEAEAARDKAIAVNSFGQEDYAEARR